MSWVHDEFQTINLGDSRLNTRSKTLIEALSLAPQSSILKSCGGWAETKAAYRLLDNKAVTSKALLAPHVEKSLERMRAVPVVLCLNDTTEMDFTGNDATTGLGPLTYEDQRGFLLHVLLAVTPDQQCLGALETQWLVRSDATHGQSKTTKKHRSLKEKESHRWPEAFTTVCDFARKLPNQRLVYVSDREGDIFELLLAAQGAPADLLIRSNQDRALENGGHLHATVGAAPRLGDVEIKVPRKPGQTERTAKLTMRCAEVILRPPWRHDVNLPPVTITVIRAREEDPPPGREPIDWILLTNRTVKTLDEAAVLLSWYVCRWRIEVFFRVLKQGCAVEKLQLQTYERLRLAITMYVIIAWRVMFLMTTGRTVPDLPCSVLLDEEEWRAAWIVGKRTPPPRKPPPLRDMIRLIASFAGFLGRKGDGEPGAKTIWEGLDAVRHYAVALAVQAQMMEGSR